MKLFRAVNYQVPNRLCNNCHASISPYLYSILSYPILSYPILSYPILSYFTIALALCIRFTLSLPPLILPQPQLSASISPHFYPLLSFLSFPLPSLYAYISPHFYPFLSFPTSLLPSLYASVSPHLYPILPQPFIHLSLNNKFFLSFRPPEYSSLKRRPPCR